VGEGDCGGGVEKVGLQYVGGRRELTKTRGRRKGVRGVIGSIRCGVAGRRAKRAGSGRDCERGGPRRERETEGRRKGEG